MTCAVKDYYTVFTFYELLHHEKIRLCKKSKLVIENLCKTNLKQSASGGKCFYPPPLPGKKNLRWLWIHIYFLNQYHFCRLRQILFCFFRRLQDDTGTNCVYDDEFMRFPGFVAPEVTQEVKGTPIIGSQGDMPGKPDDCGIFFCYNVFKYKIL